jgi:putative aldouronate transport system substrate-binding protein
MKKNLLSIMTATALCILLPSCAGTGTNDETTAISSTSAITASTEIAEKTESAESTETEVVYSDLNENLEAQNFPSYDELQTQYPDKTIIVWTFEGNAYEKIHPFRTREVNEYLNEKGYDFVVCMKPIWTETVLLEDWTYQVNATYLDQVEDMIQNGEQLDIIHSAYSTFTDSIRNGYQKAVLHNLFEPLDSYLQSGIGKELYDLMPAKHWDGLLVNGHIYGVDGAMETLSYDYGYFVNAELADKYGFDVSLPIEDQIEVLQAVRKNEIGDLFSSYEQNLITPASYLDVTRISSVMYFDESSKEAKCILDSDAYISRLRFINDIKKLGLFSSRGLSTAKSFFILQDNIPGGSTIYKSDEAVNVDYNGNIIRAIPVFNEQTQIKSTYTGTGICNQSKNKDLAFELLALTQTDPYLNNLIVYGVEGEDYNLVDGYVDNLINDLSIVNFSNKMICHRSFRAKWTPQTYIDIFENAEVPRSLGFVFDARAVRDEALATLGAMDSFNPVGTSDFDVEIEGLYTEFQGLGIEIVIEECNRQYQEYINHEN